MSACVICPRCGARDSAACMCRISRDPYNPRNLYNFSPPTFSYDYIYRPYHSPLPTFSYGYNPYHSQLPVFSLPAFTPQKQIDLTKMQKNLNDDRAMHLL